MRGTTSVLLLIALLGLAACRSEETPAQEAANPAAEQEPSAGEDRAPGTITVAPEALKNAGIQVARVEKRAMTDLIMLPARIDLDPGRVARATVVLDGRVTEVSVEVGQEVRQGDVLARVETPETLEDPAPVRSPRDGVIIERKVSLGDHADHTSPLFTIADLGVVWAMLDVPQLHAAELKVGQSLELFDPSGATAAARRATDSTWTARVTNLGNEANPDSLTVAVRLEVPNADGRLRPGMKLFARFLSGRSHEATVVPETAVQTIENRAVIFVPGSAAGEFLCHRVQIGMTRGGWTEVTEGIKPGEAVVTRGSFVLKSELLKAQLEEAD